MKRIRRVWCCGLVLFTAVPVALEARTWTSADGKTVEAEFVSAADGKVVLKRASDRREFTKLVYQNHGGAEPGARQGAARHRVRLPGERLARGGDVVRCIYSRDRLIGQQWDRRQIVGISD